MHINFVPPNKGLSVVVPGLYHDFKKNVNIPLPHDQSSEKEISLLKDISIYIYPDNTAKHPPSTWL
jgi:hypothetical protein